MVVCYPSLNILSPEEKTAAKIASMRQAEEKRRERFFDPIQRTRGVDTHALDEQVKESARLRIEAKNREIAEELKIIQSSLEAEKLEAERQAEKRLLRIEYGGILRGMMKGKEKEAIQHDSAPPGPSSMLHFQGEDPDRSARLKEQRAQQAEWIQQAIFDRPSPGVTCEGSYLPRDPFNETQRRRALAKEYQDANIKMVEEKKERRVGLETVTLTPFVNEEKVHTYGLTRSLAPSPSVLPRTSFCIPGKPTRDTFRGATADEVRSVASDCQRLAEEKKQAILDRSIQESKDQKIQESGRFENLFNEEKKLQQRRATAAAIGLENKAIAQEQLKKKSEARGQRMGSVSEAFFSGFGSGTR